MKNPKLNTLNSLGEKARVLAMCLLRAILVWFACLEPSGCPGSFKLSAHVPQYNPNFYIGFTSICLETAV